MKGDIEAKIADLRSDYVKNLPAKMLEIEQLGGRVLAETNLLADDVFKKFYTKVHGLYGSASVYQFNELANAAKRLESVLSLVDVASPLHADNKAQIQKLVMELKESIINIGQKNIQLMESVNTSLSKRVLAPSDVKRIYLLESNKELAIEWSKEAEIFGYAISNFRDMPSLLSALATTPPDVIMLDGDMLENVSVDELKKIAKDHFQNLPFLFIASKGSFPLRFKSIAMGGTAFLVKPFQIDELITELDQLMNAQDDFYRVLIVDDQEEVAKYYATLLKEAGMVTQYITNPADIDKILYEFVPDLILMDIYMPECDGYTLARIIRQQKYYESLPIIYLSREQDKLKQLNYMSAGVDDFLSKQTPTEELLLTIRNKAARYKRIRMIMMLDNLTGVYNHSYILQQLENELKKNAALHHSFAIGLVNVDDLNKINMTYGYESGDHVLRNLCLILRKHITGINYIGRYNNENFLVILPKLDSEGSQHLLNEIREQFQRINYTQDLQRFHSTFSAGVSVFPQRMSAPAIIDAATSALLKAKSTGKNRVEIFSPVN